MKQLMTKKTEFSEMDRTKQFETLAVTEYKVKRLERIVEDLMFWKEGTDFYKKAVEDYRNYTGE